jgi:hypothetical protein
MGLLLRILLRGRGPAREGSSIDWCPAVAGADHAGFPPPSLTPRFPPLPPSLAHAAEASVHGRASCEPRARWSHGVSHNGNCVARGDPATSGADGVQWFIPFLCHPFGRRGAVLGIQQIWPAGQWLDLWFPRCGHSVGHFIGSRIVRRPRTFVCGVVVGAGEVLGFEQRWPAGHWFHIFSTGSTPGGGLGSFFGGECVCWPLSLVCGVGVGAG